MRLEARNARWLVFCVVGIAAWSVATAACQRSVQSTPATQAVAEPAIAATAPSATVPTTAAPTPPVALAEERRRVLVQRNSTAGVSLPDTLLTSRIAAWKSLPVGERIVRWARLFARRTDNRYCFGPKAGCYVGDSLLVQDYRLDCVSLFYRCSELARATSPADAIRLALDTRFAGADPNRVVAATGAVDYDNPAHLDYSEDFAATGLWGRDVTREVGDAIADAAGTSRYPAGTRYFIPTARAAKARLRSGDLLLFVLDEKNAKAQALRRDYGLLVGHQAIADVEGGTIYQIHAAQSPLRDVYEGDRVVRVPLATYLQRVERFKGIMVVRIEDPDVPTDTPSAKPR